MINAVSSDNSLAIAHRPVRAAPSLRGGTVPRAHLLRRLTACRDTPVVLINGNNFTASNELSTLVNSQVTHYFVSQFCPGDAIIADESGVLVLGADEAEAIAVAAIARQERGKQNVGKAWHGATLVIVTQAVVKARQEYQDRRPLA